MSVSIPEEIKKHIQAEADNNGLQLIDLVTRGSKGFYLEILLDKEGGITLDECGAFNRKISFWLEETSLVGESFTIDASSPGLDRPLAKTTDFLWAEGKDVRVKVHEPVDGNSVFIGKLIQVSGDDEVTLALESREEVVVDRENIASAKLHVSIRKNKKQSKKKRK